MKPQMKPTRQPSAPICNLRRRSFRIALAGLAASVLLLACVQNDRVPLTEAQSELHAAISARAKRCGDAPGYPLLILNDPPEYGLRLCSLLILQGSCPFTDYPIQCLEMYSDDCDACDLPGYSP